MNLYRLLISKDPVPDCDPFKDPILSRMSLLELADLPFPRPGDLPGAPAEPGAEAAVAEERVEAELRRAS